MGSTELERRFDEVRDEIIQAIERLEKLEAKLKR